MKPLKNITLLSLLFLLLSSSTLSAQYLTLGPRLGVNATDISNIPNSEHQLSPSFGLFLLYSDETHWGFEAEALYSPSGINPDESGYVDIDLHYLSVPLTVNYFFGAYDNRFRPKVYAGPYASILLDNYTTSYETARYEFRGMDAGVVVGGGFNYELATAVWLNTDLRYRQGLVDIVTEPASDPALNRSFSFMVGIGVGI